MPRASSGGEYPSDSTDAGDLRGLGGAYIDFEICDDFEDLESPAVGWIHDKAAMLLATEPKEIVVVLDDRVLSLAEAYMPLCAFVAEGAGWWGVPGSKYIVYGGR